MRITQKIVFGTRSKFSQDELFPQCRKTTQKIVFGTRSKFSQEELFPQCKKERRSHYMISSKTRATFMGVARIFQRGGHTESYRGYSPDCHLNIVGCLLTKRLTKGGGGGVSHAPQDSLATPLHFVIQSEKKKQTKISHHALVCSHTFSRALRQALVITSSFDWSTGFSVSFVRLE